MERSIVGTIIIYQQYD